ncbi:M56 family metallopeptidase [uncultured Gimesia sp.]|uniref:M56 family metallopeptidase n=1 Tax=uncultured Gimesia sp. TaxID=1678688 RepID=UPI00261BD925|nr:M56 family metallopeptidase [uncultured Gimesia sp.]
MVEVVVLEQSNMPVPEIIVVDDIEPTPAPLVAGSEPLRAKTDVISLTPSSFGMPVTDSSSPLPIEKPITEQIVLTPLPETATTDVALPVPTVTPKATKPTSIITSPFLPGFAKCLAGLVIVIVIAGSLRFFITGRRFRRRILKFRVVEMGRVFDTLSLVVQRTSLQRRVWLLEADDFSEPIAFGIWHWTIVVPKGIETRLDQNELEALLAHELAHLVRGDTWWLLFGRLLCCCLPFQPLNFVARARWKQAAEFQCDDWAANRTGNPLSLAHCLTRVAEWRLDVADRAHVLPAGGSDSTLSLRVERLLADRPTVDPWKRSQRRQLLTAFILIVAIVLCWHGPRTTLLAKFGEQNNKLTFDKAALDLNVSYLSDEINSLNEELQQLEADLRNVELLVRNNELPSEVRTLVTHLTSRLANLRVHRRELLARSNPASTDFVKVSNTETQPSTLSAESSR